ncbi:sigma-70 family RNA polymerase sigma factor [Streptomyces sp. NPDC002596]|uniref:sigma-70 family RNA polymerase sigma factor n=2 Tax=unclassified Streptomyces TaxID=2593676 RepID=UPI0035DFA2FE
MTPDEQLMTALYTEHHDVLLSFVRRYVRSPEQAEDVVQETLLRAWRSITKIEPRHTTIRSYLFTIARNVLTDSWRAEQRRPEPLYDDEALAAVPSADDVEAALEGHVIAAALERLSSEHRDVIQALYFEGLTTAESASRLTIPEGTVKSRAYYAVRNLRAAFEEMGVLR